MNAARRLTRSMTTIMTSTGLAGTAVAMPNAIRFEVHHPARARRARLHAAPVPRSGKRSEPSTSRLSHILVATDGTAASEGAVIVAGLLARRHHASVDVVSVLPRWGEPPPDHEFLDITGELLEERLASVVPQGRRALGNAPLSWAIRVIDSSSIAESIAEIARREGHDLIVTGNRRSWISRWLRRPTALAVAQRSGVPVLVVPQSVSTLPARAVVAVEGTDFDLNADLVVVGTRPPATITERVSGGLGGQVLRAADGCVLLCGTEN